MITDKNEGNIEEEKHKHKHTYMRKTKTRQTRFKQQDSNMSYI